MLTSSVLGIFIGGFLGSRLGAAANDQFGDLAGAVLGFWLGGPVAAAIIYQAIIGRLKVGIRIFQARLIHFAITGFNLATLLAVFTIAGRVASSALVVFPVFVGINLLLAYFALVFSLRAAGYEN